MIESILTHMERLAEYIVENFEENAVIALIVFLLVVCFFLIGVLVDMVF